MELDTEQFNLMIQN